MMIGFIKGSHRWSEDLLHVHSGLAGTGQWAGFEYPVNSRPDGLPRPSASFRHDANLVGSKTHWTAERT